jgi:prolipoprotein diacylglyceryl transferase
VCLVLGILVALWFADRRYRAIGGQQGLIFDIATLAIPAGLIGARLYGVLADSRLYFGHGRDWVNILRIWDGGLGLPGAIAAGAVGAWIWCRRAGADVGPVAVAAAPALAFGQAIGIWGNWFSQRLYGFPSTWPWAVAIAPEHRVPGYESYATFQPAFLYESLWDIVVGLVVIYAIRRLLLTGDRAFALYAGLYAIGRCCTEAVLVGYSPRIFGFRVNQMVMILVLATAVGYLYATRGKRGPDAIIPMNAARRTSAASAASAGPAASAASAASAGSAASAASAGPAASAGSAVSAASSAPVVNGVSGMSVPTGDHVAPG